MQRLSSLNSDTYRKGRLYMAQTASGEPGLPVFVLDHTLLSPLPTDLSIVV